jgi:hypothetical protein
MLHDLHGSQDRVEEMANEHYTAGDVDGNQAQLERRDDSVGEGNEPTPKNSLRGTSLRLSCGLVPSRGKKLLGRPFVFLESWL